MEKAEAQRMRTDETETEIEIENASEFVEIDCTVYEWEMEEASRWTGCSHSTTMMTKPTQPGAC